MSRGLCQGPRSCPGSPIRRLSCSPPPRRAATLPSCPRPIRATGAALDRTLRALVTRGLIAEAAVEGRAKRSRWASNPLVVTPAGLAAIGVEPAAPEPDVSVVASPQRPGGKLGILLAAVARPEGATLGDLTDASGWLPHTARAAG